MAVGYEQQLLQWHDLYLAVSAAAATLAGLLFVGISLHISVVAASPEVRQLARVTLTNFFAVLLLGLLMLIPQTMPEQTAFAVIPTGVVSMLLVARAAWGSFGSGHRLKLGRRILILRFGGSAAAYAGVTATGVLFALGAPNAALGFLFAGIAFLLILAVRNTWDLLVTLAQHR